MKILVVLLLTVVSVAAAPAKKLPPDDPWNISDKQAWINWRAVNHPWRVIDGQTNYVPRAEGWYMLEGKLLQTFPDGTLLVEGVHLYRHDTNAVLNAAVGPLRGSADLAIVRQSGLNLPDKSHIRCIGKAAGLEKYTTVLGATKTVKAFDCGQPIEVPKGKPLE